MSKPLIKRFFLFAPLLLIVILVTSCSTTTKIKYFQDIPDSGQTKTIASAEYSELIIQPGDILNVTIETVDPLATTTINSNNAAMAASSSTAGGGASGIMAALSGGNQQQPVSGLLVDKEGYIEMPIIGRFKVAGYTTYQLRDTVYKIAKKYYKDPTVIVRFANFKVSIIGEVSKPGQYILPDEKESIIDAISLAGDLTIFGKRENVLLIRNNLDGTKITYRINLKKSDIMSSPEYYLRQNDIIYVEPRTAKSDANDASQARYVSIAAAVLSVLIIIATRAK